MAQNPTKQSHQRQFSKEAKETAAKETAATGAEVAPAFTVRAKAQKEADSRNMAAQTMIAAKEGIVEAITMLVGTNITDSALRTCFGVLSSHEVVRSTASDRALLAYTVLG